MFKKLIFRVLIITACITALLSAKVWAAPNGFLVKPETTNVSPIADIDIHLEALAILKNKCNTCHKKSNPFMIFSEKNMKKRAAKIKKQVFELKRMPKKGGEPLTQTEYTTLKKWIDTLKN